MTVDKIRDGSTLTVKLSGRLDTVTSKEFESSLKPEIDSTDLLILDFEDLDYISSAGLRVILAFQKLMNQKGKMVVKNVNETVNEIFDVTGFCDILTIE